MQLKQLFLKAASANSANCSDRELSRPRVY